MSSESITIASASLMDSAIYINSTASIFEEDCDENENENETTNSIPIFSEKEEKVKGAEPVFIFEDRGVIFIGAKGSGKSTLVKCFCRAAKIQNIDLPQSTKMTEGIRFGKGEYLYYVYDTKGFKGNLSEDIWVLFDLLAEISRDICKVHVVYLCLTSAQMNAADRSVLKMLHLFGGSELLSKLRIIVTHSPELAVTEELKTAVQNGIEVSVAESILFTDLEEPNFKRSAASREEAMDTWEETMTILRREVASTPYGVRLPNYGTGWKLYCIARIYFHSVLYTFLAGIVVFAFFSVCVQCFRLRGEIDSFNDALSKCNELKNLNVANACGRGPTD